MLSIRFSPNHEWWVSGIIFDRLFQSALDSGRMSSELEEWRHVADANGGLELSLLQPAEAAALIMVLRETALSDLAELGDIDPKSEDYAYRTSLLKLLEACPT